MQDPWQHPDTGATASRCLSACRRPTWSRRIRSGRSEATISPPQATTGPEDDRNSASSRMRTSVADETSSSAISAVTSGTQSAN